MKIIKSITAVFIAVFILLSNSTPVLAATFRTNQSIYLSEDQKNLSDLYLFGNSVTVDAPVKNDVITAGNTLTLNGNISGSLFAAGSDIFIRSAIGNTLRTAGSNIVISGQINRDVLIAAGNARIAKSASISGDLLFAGGQLQVDAPVKGKIYIYGGQVNINNNTGGNIEGTIGTLILGPHAVINGDLKYQSERKATIQKGAIVRGKTEYRQTANRKDKPADTARTISAGTIYKLAVDIIISLLLITFLPYFVKETIERAINSPLASAGIGFLYVIFWPFISIFLLLLIWPGIASFLLYGLVLIISIFLSKILIGWWILNWWNKRNKKEYILDWKAAITGSLASFILFLIPILGWAVMAIIYCMTAGSLATYLWSYLKNQKELVLPSERRRNR